MLLGKWAAFDNKANMRTGALVPVRYNERGIPLASLDEYRVWTGSNRTGVRGVIPGHENRDSSCVGWSTVKEGPASTAMALVGSALSADNWSSGDPEGQPYAYCNSELHLLCFEQ